MIGSTTSSTPPRRATLALLAALVLALSFVHTPDADNGQAQDMTAPFPRHGTYIGRSQCVECHQDQESKILAGTHKPALHNEIMQACETCHGPGKTHADDEDNGTALITFPPKLPRKAQEQLCGRCHAAQIEHHGGDLEGFYAAGKKCTSCHKIHTKKKPAPHAGTNFFDRADTIRGAKPLGAEKCLTCHPLSDQKLAGTGHAHLMAKQDPKGCETCHGNGSLHADTGGLARLISRPDTARDGIATCRSCHEHVDAAEFHWKDKHSPLLTKNMTCATCHTVHPTGNATPAVRKNLMPMMRGPIATIDNGSCAKCHAPAYGVLQGTVHETLGKRDIPLSQGCGACHAGAAEHARGPGHKDLVESMRGTNASFQTETCAQCHSKDRALRHAKVGAHFRNEVTCLTCHSPASPKGKTRESASQRCAECHTKAAAEFRLPNHHPVKIGPNDRGTMLCVDCHDPHSARPRIRDRRLRRDSCVKCHKQYRGPFVFQHQASRTDGCVVCHTPHGSTNRRMLKQATTQHNCITCHADFPAFHDQTSGAVFTKCLNCHTQVHGSNHSRYLFR